MYIDSKKLLQKLRQRRDSIPLSGSDWELGYRKGVIGTIKDVVEEIREEKRKIIEEEDANEYL